MLPTPDDDLLTSAGPPLEAADPPQLPSAATDQLHRLVFDSPAEILAASLYGSPWREVVVRDRSTGALRTKRDPLPLDSASFLARWLQQSAAHDGRSTRVSRSSGWWIRQDSGSWVPVPADDLGQAVIAALDSVHSAALLEASAIRERMQFEEHFGPDAGLVFTQGTRLAPLRRELADWELRAAILSGCRHAVASMSRTWRQTVAVLRDRLQAPDSVLMEAAFQWLSEQLSTGVLCPSARGRLQVSAVRVAAASHDGLPWRTLYPQLCVLLGAPFRAREWQLPDSLLALAPISQDGDLRV